MHRNRGREGGSRQSYYELFKACRLCGSGGGYKMPIVQGVPSSQHEPELRLKIRDCCSIDVRPDDRMPPLICELCVDKVNDFYEFREMCLQTNVWVRASLGLPPQTLGQDSSEDCILGVSGPLIYDSREFDTSPEVPIKTRSKATEGKKKKEKLSAKKVKINPEPIVLDKPNSKKVNPQPLLAERKSRKRNRSITPPPPPPIKKIKITNLSSKKNIQISNRYEKSPPLSAVKSKAEQKKIKETAAKKAQLPFSCEYCEMGFLKKNILKQHLIAQHSPTIIGEKLGCTPCREWFINVKLADEHHKWHKLTSTFYRCDRCSGEFKVLQGYNRHFSSKQCIPENIVPDPKCVNCHKVFVTQNLLDNHFCSGPVPVGEECHKCKKTFIKRIQLRKHLKTCNYESPNVNPNNPHLKMLKPIQIAVPKCDELLRQIKREPLDISDCSGPIYDVSCLDPSMNVIVKMEPIEENFDLPNYDDVEIKHEIKEECPDQFNECDGMNHNDDSDSDAENSSSEDPNPANNPFARKDPTLVESLSVISLRSIFNDKSMMRKVKNGKIKKKASKIKTEYQNELCSNLFDSLIEKDDDEFCMNNCESNVTSLIITSVSSGHIETSHRSDDNLPMESEEIALNKKNISIAEDEMETDRFTDDKVKENFIVSDNTQRASLINENDTFNLSQNIEQNDDKIKSSTTETQDKDIDSENNSADSENNKLYEMTCSAIKNFVENGDGKSDDSFDLASQSVDDVLDYNKDIIINNDVGILNNFDTDCKVSETAENNESVNSEPINRTNNKCAEDESVLENNFNTEINTNQESKMICDSNSDIDFEIDNMFRGELGELAMRKQNELNTLIKNNTNSAHGEPDNKDHTPAAFETPQEDILNMLTNDYLNEGDGMDKMNSDREISNEKPENDVFDLVSDSGDDCNIIDSPEKMKAMEDQLLAEEERLLAGDDFEFEQRSTETGVDSISTATANFSDAADEKRYNGAEMTENRPDDSAEAKDSESESKASGVETVQSVLSADNSNSMEL